jgi:biopolymer transport protein ExbD
MSHGGGGDSNGQDFELNLASIIDCFTVLIAFMLASASFLSIGILDAGVAAAGQTAAPGTPPPVNVIVELGRDWKATVKTTGKTNTTEALGTKPGEWDYEGLTRQLASIKGKYPSVEAVTLSADNTIEYKHLVKSMEVIRKTFPVVMLGGF